MSSKAEEGLAADRSEATAQTFDRRSVPFEALAGAIDDVDAERARAMVMSTLFGEPSEVVRVGRFVVLQLLGAGAMGRVYEAHDPQLDRRVALKLVRTARSAEPAHRERILKEAQAIAKLAHPNVVPVFEVGEDAGRPYLVMERIEGHTLRQWLAERPRSLAEILAVFEQAGRGLAAAHTADVVHRDFKPDNVLVGRDGRARIVDFGLAAPAPPPSLTGEDAGTDGDGHWFGTPAYMAPEQFLGQDVDARADQFAFCVALWEAIHGERPFGGSSPRALAASGRAGRLRAPPARRSAPRWVRRVCERGLSGKREDRWPSMDALLAALAIGRARTRTLKAMAVVGGLATLAVGVEAHRRYDIARRTAACEATGDEIEAAWSDERRQRLYDALLATGVSQAATTADKTMPWLDRQAAAWREARVEACLDADVRSRWDAETLERSQWCLDERRMELQSLVDELIQADAMVLSKAVTAASGLSAVDSCRDPRALELLSPPPPEEHEALHAIRADVARAGSRLHTGRYAEGLALASAALAAAEARQWRPLTARARARMGALLTATGTYAQAEAALEDAYFEAAGGVDREVAQAAAEELVFVVGVRSARLAEGRRWGRLAEVELAGLPEGMGLRRATLLAALASVDTTAGDHDRARQRYEQALAILEPALGASHPTIAKALVNLGNAHSAAGSADRAARHYERALAMTEATLGPEHPSMVAVLVNLANVHEQSGAYEEALALYERALSILDHTLEPEHPDRAAALHGLATVHYATGAYDRAKERYRQALSLSEKTLGPNHPHVGLVLYNLGAVHEATGARDEAKVAYEQALARFEASLGARHPQVAYPLLGLASLALAAERPAEAVTLAEKAVAIRNEHHVPAALAAEAGFVLARALWAAPTDGGRDRTRAWTLAEQARDALRGAGPSAAASLAEVERWLDEHAQER